ncbi:MAG: UDP-N-acetylmuramoyl-L-alanyl-D-glutamate--2,6-diaminopimelate ligase [Clostridia bacterium]|nr:UDP-N-acetylmuramoyl-L-alanyl-D-glutamate--2,6-diaminopimelate ligase [Clostridia bacterium]
MVLSKILDRIEGLVFRGNIETEISEICYDSRNVKPNCMFVAIKGFQTDGHAYIESAIEKGATVIALEEGAYDVDGIPENISVVISQDTRELLALMACNFYSHPAREFKLIGITGTKGKTTTSYMIKSILENSGKKVGLIGTIANYIGNEEIPTERTTPESLDLQRLFRRMADSHVDVVVMEVSSHSLALKRVAGITFDYAIFTNLTQDHLDFHKTFDNYLAAKAKLFTIAKEGFVNCDDMYASRLMKLATCPITTYGIDNNPFVSARDIIITNSYSEFKLPFNKMVQKIKVSIPGRFTVYNALAAICVCIKLGSSVESIITALETIKVPGRSEVVPNLRGYTILVDYAHTPDSLENILKACKTYTKGDLICVFGCGGDRDKAKRPMMGEIAGKLAAYTVITTDNPRTENPESIIKEIEAGIKNTKGKYKIVVNRAKAIEHALRRAKKNDLVLIAGKGHETYQEINGIKHHFDDKEVINDILKKLPEVKDDDLYLW